MKHFYVVGDKTSKSLSPIIFNHWFKKYKITLDEDSKTTYEWLQNIQEELMDAVNYIEKLKSVIKIKR